MLMRLVVEAQKTYIIALRLRLAPLREKVILIYN